MTTLKDKATGCDNWKSILRHSYLSWEVLLNYLDLKPEQIQTNDPSQRTFPFKVTSQYASRIQKGNPKDPLLRQIIPLAEEEISHPDYQDDPLKEIGHRRDSSLLINKYKGRALMITTGSCAIHCRYCFRKHFPYTEKIGHQKILTALDELQHLNGIHELILSGGDPLILDDLKLDAILKGLSEFPHIRRVRIHTRIPVVFPPRITPSLLRTLSNRRYALILVTHINHPNEIDEEVRVAINALRQNQITLLNQSVLLKDVNDDYDTLLNLSNKLFEIGILPYYIHMLDKVTGTTHYGVTRRKAKSLQKLLFASLPAYLVPRFVEEIPGIASKNPI